MKYSVSFFFRNIIYLRFFTSGYGFCEGPGNKSIQELVDDFSRDCDFIFSRQ